MIIIVPIQVHPNTMCANWMTVFTPLSVLQRKQYVYKANYKFSTYTLILLLCGYNGSRLDWPLVRFAVQSHLERALNCCSSLESILQNTRPSLVQSIPCKIEIDKNYI